MKAKIVAVEKNEGREPRITPKLRPVMLLLAGLAVAGGAAAQEYSAQDLDSDRDQILLCQRTWFCHRS
jgi:hypothetical protein